MVVGLIALLLAILLPPLRLAHRQALATRCGTQLQQIGIGLQAGINDSSFYPLWDDAAQVKRYTWIDLLVQRTYLGNTDVGYCPEDPSPSALNAQRASKFGLLYPGQRSQAGLDYSYGISTPLSAGAWAWTSSTASTSDYRSRRLPDYDRFTAQRILAADGTWSNLYNFSADAFFGHDVDYPTQYDNRIDWRHINLTANILFQDGHVARVRYAAESAEPVDTARIFFWYRGEPVHAGPGGPPDPASGGYYPGDPLADLATGEGGKYPRDMAPGYYTHNKLWTRILHK